MAVFNISPSASRYYSKAADNKPDTAGLTGGSRLLHVDTGERFIYDGKDWVSFVGNDADLDLLAALVKLQATTEESLAHTRIIRAATAEYVNEAVGSVYTKTDGKGEA